MLNMLSIYSLILLICMSLSIQRNYPTAKTTWGKIRGHYKYSYHDRKFSAFEGIPYAKPPIGGLRFKKPQNPDPWFGTLNTSTVYICIQNYAYQVLGTEDCLYINVYVPRIQPVPNENLDIIVSIHGGGHEVGGALLSNPLYLMDRDIIFIDFSYRLNIFGFLSTGDKWLPGNLGCKDQVFALKWVQSNAKFFGGNPDAITLIGSSSGGGDVHLHYFSPLSKGLFHRGISLGGVAMSRFYIESKPLQNAIRFGKLVGCNNSSTQKLVRCIKSKSATYLVNQIEQMHYSPGVPLFLFAPVVEKMSESAFLTNYPYPLLKAGLFYDVPWLTTTVPYEGISVSPMLTVNTSLIESQYEYLFPHIFLYNNLNSNADKSMITLKIRQYYFRNKKINLRDLSTAIGDSLFNIPLEIAIRTQSKISKSPIYTLLYNYSASIKSKYYFKGFESEVGHTEDSWLISGYNLRYLNEEKENLTASDVIIKNALLDIVTSFARNGVPKYQNINWKPINGSEEYISYLYIKDPKTITINRTKEFGPNKFWLSLPLKDYQ